MDNLIRMNEILNQPAVFWSLAAFLFLMVSYSAYKTLKYYVLLGEMKKKKAEMESELSKVNAKLEGLRDRLIKRGKN